ncbi:Sec-independent protein translocase subunit TatA [Arthrobacter sp. Sa2BUA2]|uniref:Sec-independent protein translocase protein TatA n=1 Tax=Arthrobacter pullicola TaxID=2762224 RepID=A0ABR8YMX4_9MICC|nr:Sec-independent protein translocase subunit TatA [Arthrobacter pullicola]MBD8045398.1 Sec-independent protein translocase subunit TatA [Arthrobacter pullicola]
MRLEGWHIVIIVVLAILLFGAPKLPGLARSVGQSLRIFKSEVRQLKDEDGPSAPATDPVTGAVIPPVPPAGATPPAPTVPGPTAGAPVPPPATEVPRS